MAKARYLNKVIALVEKIESETVSPCMANGHSDSISVCVLQGQDGTSHYLVQAKLAILGKQFKQAESILLERVSVMGCSSSVALHVVCVCMCVG